MKKVIKSILLIITLFSFMTNVFAVSEVSAETLGELRSNYEALLKKQKENNNLTAAAKAEIARKEAAIKQAEADIHEAEEEMEQVQVAIDESNEKIGKLTKEAENVLLYLQQLQGENAYVEYVSGASTMTELITRIAVVEQISGHIQQTMVDLENEIKKNEELKEQLQEKKETLEKQAKEYERIIAENYDKLEEYDKYALDIDTQVVSAKKNLDTYEKLCKENLGSTSSSVKLVDCLKAPTNDGWLKPLKSGIITSVIGPRWGSYHNALDIGGSSPFEGTPVYAAAAGTVSGMISRYSCGGNMLYIDVVVDGKKYTTFYYHLLSFNVKMGDVVDQNTVIGYVGGYSTSTAHGGYDSCTTGAHLHFGVANGFYNGYSVPRSNIITPPGFPNRYGWRFTSRTQMYQG